MEYYLDIMTIKKGSCDINTVTQIKTGSALHISTIPRKGLSTKTRTGR